MTRAATSATPSVKIRPPEVELAPWPVLLGRDRPLRCQLAQRVLMHAEVLGGVPRVEPLGLWLVRWFEVRNDRRGYMRSASCVRRPSMIWSLLAPMCSSSKASGSARSCSRVLAYADIVVTPPLGLGRAPGCGYIAGAAFAYVRRLSPRPDRSAFEGRLYLVAPRIDLEDLVDAHGVAEILGLSHRNTVSQYQKRYPDMPRPIVDLGGGLPSCGSAPSCSDGPRNRLH